MLSNENIRKLASLRTSTRAKPMHAWFEARNNELLRDAERRTGLGHCTSWEQIREAMDNERI